MGTQVNCPRVVSGCRFVGARGALELHLTRECEYASADDQLVPAGRRESGAVDAPSESLESDIPDCAAAAARNANASNQSQAQSAFQQPSTGLRRSASQHKQSAGGAKSAALSAELARKELSLSPRRAPSRDADAERELLDGALQPVYPRHGTAFTPIQHHQQQQQQLQQQQQAMGGRAQVRTPSAFATRSVRLVQQQQQQAAFAMHDNGNGSCLAPMAQCAGGGVSFAASALEASQVFTSATATLPKLPSPMEIMHLTALAAGAGTSPSPPAAALHCTSAPEAMSPMDGELITLELTRGCFDLGISFVGGIDTPLVRHLTSFLDTTEAAFASSLYPLVFCTLSRIDRLMPGFCTLCFFFTDLLFDYSFGLKMLVNHFYLINFATALGFFSHLFINNFLHVKNISVSSVI